MRFEPRDYQWALLKHLDEGADSLVFVEMGLGKTVCVLTHIAKVLREAPSERRRYLVVAPLRVCRYVWRQESQKWDHLRHLRIGDATVPSTARRRDAIRDPEYDIVLLNYEKLPWLCDAYRNGWPFYGLVLDEVDKMKATGTRRFRRMRSRTRQFENRIGMTGTPTPESLHNIWGPTFLVTNEGHGHRLMCPLGPSQELFHARHFYQNGWQLIPHDDAVEKVTKKIEPYVYAAKAADHVKLPDLVVKDVYFDLPPDVYRLYKKLEKELFVALTRTEMDPRFLELLEKGEGEEDKPADATIEVAHAAAKSNKLRQLCAGFMYDEDHKACWVHKEMYKAYESVRSELMGEPHLVIYGFQAERDYFKFPDVLSSRLSARDEAQLLKTWDAGQLEQLAFHPASGGHGLNLQDSGAHHIIYLTLPWSRGLYDQTCARLHRLGQKKTVFVHRLVAKDTVVEKVVKALEGKGAVQDEVFAAIRKAYQHSYA